MRGEEMPGQIGRFEDLLAWQKARQLTQVVYHATQQGNFSKDFGLAGQIQRASVSIMSNIAEGYERGNPGDFHRFLSVAKASCAEVRSQLYVALDIGHISQSQFNELMTQAEEVGRIIGGLRMSIKHPKHR
jgi:four helix bundle protein